MMENVVSLAAARPDFEDVVATLRSIADDLEKGEIEMPVTTAVLLLGSTSQRKCEQCEDFEVGSSHIVYAMGPRTDPFTVRGLLTTAAAVDAAHRAEPL